ncbi:replication initiation factor domain-containing protein [Geobacter sp.]|uniref:replication initiation factor domain-containing protein n=1 Tax=Geobacter sp. TaxID=46610 RepID=UPI0026121A74|nr:replication initiation factor domain-containing protein [Geobacter sp.]
MQLDSIKFDWVSFTIPRNLDETTLPAIVQELFGLDFSEFRLIQKKRNYYKHSYLLSGPNGDKLVEVFADPDTEHNRNTTLFQVSGYALSAYAGNPLSIDVPELFGKVLALGGKPTILHIAMDDTAGRLPWDTMVYMSSHDEDRYQKHIVCKSRRPPNTMNNGTIYFGLRSDRNSVCIYRKDRQEGTKFPWIRVEYRTKDRDTAKAIAEKVAAGDNLGPLAAGLIRRHLTFKEAGHKVKYNRPDCSWWVDFLGGVEKMFISRDIAPRRKPTKERKARTMPSIYKDLDSTLKDPSAFSDFMEYLEARGILDIARFGHETVEEPETVVELQEPQTVETTAPMYGDMLPPPTTFDPATFAIEIQF